MATYAGNQRDATPIVVLKRQRILVVARNARCLFRKTAAIKGELRCESERRRGSPSGPRCVTRAARSEGLDGAVGGPPSSPRSPPRSVDGRSSRATRATGQRER